VIVACGEAIRERMFIPNHTSHKGNVTSTTATPVQMRVMVSSEHQGDKMRKVTILGLILVIGLGLGVRTHAAERPAWKSEIPNHYKLVSGDCRAGRGYSFVAEATGHPSTYPKLILLVFNGEIIGTIFEADASAGWKPWYDQPKGAPMSHGGGPAHYSQAIYVKRPPTTEECASSTGAWGKGKSD
jgi:hypothetical protein